MVTLVTSYRELLRDQVGPALRRCGFAGSNGRWTLRDPVSGDLAIVQAQGSKGNTADEVMFFVNLAVVPLPWWRYTVDLYAHPGEPKEYHGVWRKRVERPGPEAVGRDEWRFTDATSAHAVGARVADLLTTTGVPLLRRYLDRSALLDHLRTRDVTRLTGGEPLAVVLSDAGPSAELDAVLETLLDSLTPDSSLALQRKVQRLLDWTVANAAR
jgi:hypothetical protein